MLSLRYYKRRSTIALACCLASKATDGKNAANASLSTLAAMLSDPSLLGDHRAARVGADEFGDDSSSYFDVVDPGSTSGRDVVGRVGRMGREDAALAIKRANTSLAGWRDDAAASSGRISRTSRG